MALELTRELYREVLEDLGMWTFPNPIEVGSPGRHVESNPVGFFRWIEGLYGKENPLFIGHNGFAVPSKGAGLDRGRIQFRYGFGDLDTGDGNGLTAAQVKVEAQRVAKWLVAQRMGHVWLYSGSDGGFHVRPKFAAEIASRTYLERWESAFWRGLQTELSLRSINIRCANPICLERLPFTPYVHKKDPNAEGYKRESNYCVPVPYEWVLNGEWDRIRELSYNPEWRGSVAYHGDTDYYLEAFVRLKGWETWAHETGAFHPLPENSPVGAVADLMRVYFPDQLCLTELPFGANPRHDVRRAWIYSYLNLDPKPTLENALEITDRLAEEAQWVDRANRDIRRYQVEYAYRVRYSWPLTCQGRREHGVCVGERCPMFRTAFPVEWSNYLLHHADPASSAVPATSTTEVVDPVVAAFAPPRSGVTS